VKVLFLTYWFPTDANPQKGIFILEQAKALRREGAEVTIVHVRIEAAKGLLSNSVTVTEVDSIPLVTIDLSGGLWKLVYTLYPVQLVLVRRALAKAGLAVSEFDIIHSHVVHPAGAIGHRLAKEFGKPHFISEHWSNLEYYFSKNWFSSWGKAAYTYAKRIFVVSEFLRKGTSKFVPDPSKLEVVPNVVSAEAFKFRARPVGTSYYFVMAAKWNKSKRVIKRPKLLIKAVADASKKLDKPVILGIIGDGDRVPELKKYCEQLEVHAQFHGFIPKEAVAKEFQKADLFLHGSEYETFSVVVAEALKCGTPVVGSNVAAIPELINASNGVLVENKLSAWTNGIVHAMQTPFDRHTIAESFSTKFGYEEVGKMLLDAYRR
jgi:glycosyltransferase involved in cell wall biosynthesis